MKDFTKLLNKVFIICGIAIVIIAAILVTIGLNMNPEQKASSADKK